MPTAESLEQQSKYWKLSNGKITERDIINGKLITKKVTLLEIIQWEFTKREIINGKLIKKKVKILDIIPWEITKRENINGKLIT